MKKRPFTTLVLTGTLALATLFALHPGFAQDNGGLKRSGKIEMQIDPSQEGFDLGKIEKSIRDSAKSMGLDATQQKKLDESIQQLREGVKSHKDGGTFQWKWEYQTSGEPESADAPRSTPKPRNQRQRPQAQGRDSDPREMLQQLFGEGKDPSQFLEQMLKQFGEQMQGQQGPNGGRQFKFRLGPNGLQNEDGNEDGAQQNPLDGLKRLMGQRDHEYNPETAPRESKYSRSTLAEYRSCVKDARASTVSVVRNGQQVALGTVVTADGYILTKASEVGKGPVECGFMDGNFLPAKVVNKLDADDLALLKVEGNNFKPVTWKEAEVPVGTMLAASGIDENPISVGVLSVQARNLDDSNKGFAGLALKESGDGAGVAIMQVVSGGPSDKAGIDPTDVILAIDGTKVKHPHELMKIIASKGPGDVAKFTVKATSGQEEEVAVTLGSRAEMNRINAPGVDPTAQMGTNLSERPSGFPSALQNDLGINANQCGGPVVDIDGNVVGLNIARSGRTSTLMLAGKVVKGLLGEVANGKLVAVKDPATLDKEVRKAEAALKSAQDALKSAQDAKGKVGQ